MSCPDCFQGVIMSDYQPQGTLTQIHGLETYVVKPPDGAEPKGIIIILPDAFGLPFPNNKHLADTYARDGSYLVYLPDFMEGTPAPSWLVYTFPKILRTNLGITNWLLKPFYVVQAIWGMSSFMRTNSFAKSMPRVTKFFNAVRENESKQMKLPIGCAGFCWGGLHTFALASGEYKTASGQVLCDAHFTAHPSNVTIPADAKKIRLPFSLAAATEDIGMKLAQSKEVEAIIREKEEKGELKDSEVKYYEGAGHGFGVRADPGNKEVKKHADDSIIQALDFYRKVFSGWTAP